MDINSHDTHADVIVLGAGVAGLTAAHELAKRGFTVDVYEARAMVGGKARSFRLPPRCMGADAPKLPAEHGFRFFPGFYRHLFDTMKEIPTGHRWRSNVRRQLRFARRIVILRAQDSGGVRLVYPTQLWRARGWLRRELTGLLRHLVLRVGNDFTV